MKWLGNYIIELIARFRSDVYFNGIKQGGDSPDGYIGVDGTKLVEYRTPSEVRSDIGAGTVTGVTITDDDETAHSSTTNFSMQIAGGAGIGTGLEEGILTIDANSASTSAAGVVELATTAETTTGTATGLAVTPDGLKDGYQGSGNIRSVGTITSGTWTGTTIAVANGGTGATTLNNLITLTTHTSGNYVATVTGGTGITSTGATSGEGIAHSLSVDASQTQITGVGTISTGTWQGTAIASSYLENKIVLTSQAVYLQNPAANEIHMGNTNYGFDSDVITAVSVVDADPTTMSLAGNLAASGIVVPFNIKNIDVKAYYRPAQTSGTAPFSGTAASATVNSGDDITVAIRVFEASRPDQNNSTLTLTQRGAFTDALTNAGGHKNKHYYQLDSGSPITDTINAGQLLFLGFEITDAGSHGMTGNVKFNYTVYADKA